jgi:hypothetical protein
MKKKIIITLLMVIVSFMMFLMYKNQNKISVYSITGTYNHETTPFNTIVFEEETMTYHFYTLDSEMETSGEFSIISENTYLLISGPLGGNSIEVSKDAIMLVNEDTGDTQKYNKTSDIPTVQSKSE